MNTTTLSDLWATRPRRHRADRKVAGVCAAFGARYNVDPTVIRVAFVVAALFGGSGVLLYLIGVFTLPSDRRTRSGREFGPDPSWPRIVLIGVLALVVVTNIGNGDMWSSGGVLGTALMLGGWWLLYQRTPIAPPGTSAATPLADPTATAPLATTPLADPPATTPEAARVEGPPAPLPEPGDEGARVEATTAPLPEPGDEGARVEGARVEGPPRWDPLGVAPFAWDLPEPSAAPAPVVTTPKSSIPPITTGAAIVVAALGTVAHLLGVEWFTVGRIASLALVVVAIGMLVAAFQRRTEGKHAEGLIPLGVLVGAIAIVATLVSSTQLKLPSGGIGERAYTITNQTELHSEYALTVGSTTLDLRGLEMLDHDTAITINQGIGDVKVLLPEKVRVRPECRVSVGESHCPQGIVGGQDDGKVLTINAKLGMGNVEMKR